MKKQSHSESFFNIFLFSYCKKVAICLRTHADIGKTKILFPEFVFSRSPSVIISLQRRGKKNMFKLFRIPELSATQLARIGCHNVPHVLLETDDSWSGSSL
jgi:hypothetical protein